MLVSADMIARSVAAPAELPIVIITAAPSAPVFLRILLRHGVWLCILDARAVPLHRGET